MRKVRNRQGYFWGARFNQLNRPAGYGFDVFIRVKVLDRAGRLDSGQFAGLCGFKPHPDRGGQASGGLSMPNFCFLPPGTGVMWLFDAPCGMQQN